MLGSFLHPHNVQGDRSGLNGSRGCQCPWQTRAKWERGQGQADLTCWSPGSISGKREKENGAEQAVSTLGISEGGGDHRNAECGTRKNQRRQKKPRIQGRP